MPVDTSMASGTMPKRVWPSDYAAYASALPPLLDGVGYADGLPGPASPHPFPRSK